MKRQADKKRNILVVDIGASHVKCAATNHQPSVRFSSGKKMGPERMMKQLLKVTDGWGFDAVSIGFPGVVHHRRIACEPHNMASGWIGFDFHKAFGVPVRIINDAAMQALGGYDGGKMLFLGLGTGLGSALIVEGVIAAMELSHLHYGSGRTYEDCVGEKAREQLGNKKWRHNVDKVVDGFRKALLPDYIVLGGGNVVHLKQLPPSTRRGDNAEAIVGGFRLWESHHSEPCPATRSWPTR